MRVSARAVDDHGDSERDQGFRSEKSHVVARKGTSVRREVVHERGSDCAASNRRSAQHSTACEHCEDEQSQRRGHVLAAGFKEEENGHCGQEQRYLCA